MTYFVSFMLAFAVAAGLTPLLRVLAPVIGGIDLAKSSRNVHTSPIPRIGGVAIVAAFYTPLVGLLFYSNDVSALFLSELPAALGLFIAGIAIALLGFCDDLYGVRARTKLVVQIGVALLLFRFGYQIHTIAGYSLGIFEVPVTLLWIVGIINAMNLIDGLDGLAGGVAAIAVALNFAIAFSRPEVLMCLYMASLGGAVVGFLLYNFNPATIFMGDSGSMFLGLVLACSSITTSQKSAAAISMVVPIIGLGLPIADTLLAVIRRSLRGRPIFAADREHIHHRLIELGLTHRQAVLTLYGACLALGLLAASLNFAAGEYRPVLLATSVVVIIAALRWLGYLNLDPGQAQVVAAARARNQGLRAAVRESEQKLKVADRTEVVWEAVKYLAPVLRAKEMQMSVVVQEAAGEEVRQVHAWRDRPADGDTKNDCAVKLRLERRPAPGTNDARPLGEIVVTWADGRHRVERDDEIALEMLKDHVESALARLDDGREAAGLAADEAGSTVIPFRKRSG